MDKEFLKKYNLQEAVKRFQQINEYTFITSPVIAEDGEDEEQPEAGGEAQQGSQSPTQDGGAAPMQGDGQVPEGQPQPDGGGGEGVPQPMPGPDANGGGVQPQGDMAEDGGEADTVIDVDDLTNSQEATEYKIDGVDDKLTRMLGVLMKFNSAIEASDRKIADLRDEIEKRMPSDQEKLNIRSQASYPYSETPKGFWDGKTAENPHYTVIYDNDVPTAKEQERFDIKRDDVKNINVKEVSDSFDLDDMKLDDFMNFKG